MKPLTKRWLHLEPYKLSSKQLRAVRGGNCGTTSCMQNCISNGGSGSYCCQCCELGNCSGGGGNCQGEIEECGPENVY